MTTAMATTTGPAIEAIVLSRFGAGATFRVTQYRDRIWDDLKAEKVEWFSLAIQRGPQEELHTVGRRRDPQGLIKLAETCQL
jgi:hypothetical protein